MASALGMGSARERLAPQAMMTAAKSRRRWANLTSFPILCVATDLDAEGLNYRDFCPDQFTRQAIAGGLRGIRFRARIEIG